MIVGVGGVIVKGGFVLRLDMVFGMDSSVKEKDFIVRN